MANAIPLLEGTAASGGFLVPDNFNGLLFERGINRQSALLSMPGLRVRRVNGKREQFTEYVGRPTVATVAEGADKAATGAEYAQVTCDIVKAATVVMYTEELIEDAQDDPTILINQDVGPPSRTTSTPTPSAATPPARSSARSTARSPSPRRPSSSRTPAATASRPPCPRRWPSSRATATRRPA
jgi:hypothetical protein